jgi:hypothetical protein
MPKDPMLKLLALTALVGAMVLYASFLARQTTRSSARTPFAPLKATSPFSR